MKAPSEIFAGGLSGYLLNVWFVVGAAITGHLPNFSIGWFALD
jgi:hypothetical protein